MTMPTVAQLRQTLRQQRRQLSPHQRQVSAQSLCQHLLSCPIFQRARHIGSYLAQQGEQDPAGLMQQAIDKQWYLPIVQEHPRRQLYFAPYQPGDLLQPNQYRIPEPVIPRPQWVEPQALDCLLVPLVAFDEGGHRLGMGGGYYDRTLAYQRQQPLAPPYLIGIAHRFQLVDSLPHNEWDIPLHAIATEQGIQQRVIHR